MALTAASKVAKRDDSYFEFAVRNTAQLYTGSMVACDANGRFLPAGNASATTAAYGRSDSTITGDGTTAVKVVPGIYCLSNSSGTGAITIADRGKLCYAVDDETVHRLSGSRQVMGVVYDVDTDGVWVMIDPNLVAAVLGAVSASATTILHARGASTGNIVNLAAFTVAGVDGLTYVANERILLKDQGAASENGLYVVGTVAGGTAPLTRALDADGADELVPNCYIAVSEGTLAADTMWQLTTNAPITIGTSNLVFTAAPLQFGLVGVIVANTPDLATAAGTAATAARADHAHGTACDVPVAHSTDAAANAEGAAATFARSNHIHQHTQAAGLLGARPAAAVAGVTYFQTDSAPGVYRDTGAAWAPMSSLIQYKEATITSADLTAAGVGPESENIGAAVLPAGAIIVGYSASLTDAFDNGAGASLAMEIGINGDVDAFEDGFNCYTGSPLEGVGATFVTRGPGVGCPPIAGSSRQCTATFTAGGDTLANFTNGSVTVRVYYIDIA
jgi:hypothetical protein